MNMFIRELKANRKALLIWSICMFFLVVSGMGKYTAYSAGGASSDVFEKLPHSVKALLGFGSFEITKMSGYFAMLFLYMELAAAIHAVLLGSGIIAKEERDKTTEFLLTRPVSRVSIITAKLVAALFQVLVVNAVSLVSSIIMVSAYNKGEDITPEIVQFLISMLLIQLIFLSLGAVIASGSKKSKGSGSLSIGILLLAFLFSKITDLTDKVNALNLLSPFKYFSYADIVDGKGLNIVIILLSIGLTAIFSILTYAFYQRRDMNI
ncbi:MAG: transporter, permease protein [Herbinix sp.]|jgi:ABC-2 type transport system permease protein|nr:transporter, permease protein [Herbinix sp.]